jgi:hypothetical protein
MAERRKMMVYLERLRFREPLRIEYAEKEHAVREEYLRELEEQSALANNLARISPSVNYENLISALAKTDSQSHLRFIEQSRIYRHTLIDYLRSKDAFTSFLFFTRMKEEEMFDGEEYLKRFRKVWSERDRQVETGKTLSEASPWHSVEPLNLSDMPVFQFREPGIADGVSHAMSDLVILVVLNLLFFMFAHFSFLRGGVR